MSLKKFVAGLLLCLYIHSSVNANSYKGIVTDDLGNPMEFVNVLIQSNDTAFINGTVTDKTGFFEIVSKKESEFLKISVMGFEDRIIENPDTSLMKIILTPASYMLGEIEVKRVQTIAKIQEDGIKIQVSGTYLSKAGTAKDLMGKLPFVVKTGNEVEVIGKGTPAFYVNGRKVRDLSEIDQLSSDQIKSVDVITSPGARYDASVNAVIKITTVTPVGEGFSFTERTTIGIKHYVYLFEQVNLNYRKKGFDLFATMVYENYRERPSFQNDTYQYLKTGTVFQKSQGKEFSKYPVYKGKIGLNFNSGNNDLGLYYDFSYKPSVTKNSSNTSRFLDDLFSQYLDDNSFIRKHYRQHLLSAYYTGNLGRWQLSANFDALLQKNDKHNSGRELSSLYPERDFLTVNDVSNRLLSGNFIALVTLWKGSLSFGTEVTAIFRQDKYTGNEEYITDSDNKIKETKSALFVDTRQSFGPINIGVGLRLEYTDSRFYNFGILKPEESRKYLGISPSASFSFPIGKVDASIAYTRKTSHPGFEQLSSAVKYLDRYMYESGNPNLKPVYRDYLTLSSQWKNLIVEIEFTSTKNYFMWQTFPYNESEDILIITLQNMPRFISYGFFANYSPSFFGIWHPNFMVGVEGQNFKIIHNNMSMTLNKPMGIFRFNNAIHLPWDIWCNLDFSGGTTGNSENLYVKSQWGCNLSFFKSFSKDRFTLKLQLNDVFNTMKTGFILYDAISLTKMEKFYDSRDLQIVFTYNFNSVRSRYKGKGAGNEDKGRL